MKVTDNKYLLEAFAEAARLRGMPPERAEHAARLALDAGPGRNHEAQRALNEVMVENASLYDAHYLAGMTHGAAVGVRAVRCTH